MTSEFMNHHVGLQPFLSLAHQSIQAATNSMQYVNEQGSTTLGAILGLSIGATITSIAALWFHKKRQFDESESFNINLDEQAPPPLSQSKSLRVIEHQQFSNNSHIVLTQFHEHEILLGISGKKMQILASYEAAEKEESESASITTYASSNTDKESLDQQESESSIQFHSASQDISAPIDEAWLTTHQDHAFLLNQTTAHEAVICSAESEGFSFKSAIEPTTPSSLLTESSAANASSVKEDIAIVSGSAENKNQQDEKLHYLFERASRQEYRDFSTDTAGILRLREAKKRKNVS